MSIFLILLAKIIPLYVIILLGFIAGKYLEVKRESIASLLIYVIAPVTIFSGIITLTLSPAVLSLPVLFFVVGSIMCALFYRIGGYLWKTSEKNVLAFTSGSGNTGYFGLPVVLALFGQEAFGLAIITTLGLILYENSVGFYAIARGQHSVKESLIKLIKLPTLYAFFIALIVNVANIHFSQGITDTLGNFKGAYTVLGMMMIGLGLSSIAKFSVDWKFTSTAFFAKFLIYPLLLVGVIMLDMQVFHFYNAFLYKIILLMAIVPLASNTVAFATKLNVHPEKAATTVFLSTVFALFYIPLIMSFVQLIIK